MNEYILKAKTGEVQVFDFLKRFAFNVDKKDVSFALKNTREIIKNEKIYTRGLFFKVILRELQRDIDWRLAQDLEDEFVKFL